MNSSGVFWFYSLLGKYPAACRVREILKFENENNLFRLNASGFTPRIFTPLIIVIVRSLSFARSGSYSF